MFIDTHAHIYNEYYDDINEVINNAKKNNINFIINNGCNNSSNREVLELSGEYNSLFCALGIHPEEVLTYSDSDIEFIENNLSNKKVVAIGEIGLDYYYSKDNKDEQIVLFEKQLLLAEKYNLPVIIHSREATQDTINSLKKFKVKGIIHCFSGSLETAKEYLKMGFLLGVNGVITFKNAKIKDVFMNIDESNIVFETDSPYLTPVPNRGKKNEPYYILDTIKFYSELKGIDLVSLSNITNANIRRVFDKISF